jgi:hypothetical protein
MTQISPGLARGVIVFSVSNTINPSFYAQTCRSMINACHQGMDVVRRAGLSSVHQGCFLSKTDDRIDSYLGWLNVHCLT